MIQTVQSWAIVFMKLFKLLAAVGKEVHENLARTEEAIKTVIKDIETKFVIMYIKFMPGEPN